MRLLTVCDRSGRKGRRRGGVKPKIEFLQFRLLMCGSEVEVEKRCEQREKRKGFRIEGERDSERVTGKGGEGMREVKVLRGSKVMRGRESMLRLV